MTSGLYTITNLVDGKMLIGQSTNISKRLMQHLTKLRGNYHENDYLQKAFNKYKEENFKFEVLEYCDKQFLLSEENYWCNLLDTHNEEHGYNILVTNPYKQVFYRIRPAVKRPITYTKKFSEEAKLRMSISKKEYYRNHPHPNTGRRTPEDVKARVSDKLKGKNFHTEKGLISISNSSKNRIKSAEEIAKIVNFHKGRKRKKESIQKMIDNSKTVRAVIQYDMNGNFIREWNRIAEAAKFISCHSSGISKCCRNQCK